MAAGLTHPHIVPIHRVGEAGGFVFFVMSYVEGETLGERLRALVTDLGIAHGSDDSVRVDDGKVMGTAHFMSPEQVANGPTVALFAAHLGESVAALEGIRLDLLRLHAGAASSGPFTLMSCADSAFSRRIASASNFRSMNVSALRGSVSVRE